MPTAVSGARVWLADELRADRRHVYQLSESDVEELDTALECLKPKRREIFKTKKADFPLGSFGQILEKIRSCLEIGPGIQLIKGIPIERYTESEAALICWGLGLHIGRSIPQNQKGELITSVRDAGRSGTKDVVRGYETGSPLPFHSDSCDVVGLLCLSEAREGGISMVASSYAVHNKLLAQEPELLSALYQPFYIDRRGEGRPGALPYYATPVFMLHRGSLFSRFNPGYIVAAQQRPDTPRLTSLQLRAIQVFKDICVTDEVCLRMSFRRGDLQLLNNNITVHARSPYVDHPKMSYKRHLMRLWLTTLSSDDLPPPMLDRYQDMDQWRIRSHIPHLLS